MFVNNVTLLGYNDVRTRVIAQDDTLCFTNFFDIRQNKAFVAPPEAYQRLSDTVRIILRSGSITMRMRTRE